MCRRWSSAHFQCAVFWCRRILLYCWEPSRTTSETYCPGCHGYVIIIQLLFLLSERQIHHITEYKHVVLLSQYIQSRCSCVSLYEVFFTCTLRCSLTVYNYSQHSSSTPICTNIFFLLIVFHAVLCPKLNIVQLIEASRQDWFCLLWVMTVWKSLLLLVCGDTVWLPHQWCLSRSCEVF